MGSASHDAKSKAIVIPPVGEGSESSLVTPLNGDQDRNDRRKDNFCWRWCLLRLHIF